MLRQSLQGQSIRQNSITHLHHVVDGSTRYGCASTALSIVMCIADNVGMSSTQIPVHAI